MNTSPRVVALLLVAVVLVGTVSSVKAEMISFQEDVSPTAAYKADATFVWANKPNDKCDSTRPNEVIVGTDAGIRPLRGLLEFDLSEINMLAAGLPLTIDSVQLVMNTYSTGYSSSITVDLHQYDYNLIEEDSTWYDPDGGGLDLTDGGTLGTFLASEAITLGTANEDVVFSDTAALRTAISDALGSADHTLRLILVDHHEGVSAQLAYFCSNEYSSTGRHPELIVNFTVVPEPSTILLAGLAALAGFSLTRRRGR